MQRSAKPRTAVRFRPGPREYDATLGWIESAAFFTVCINSSNAHGNDI